MQDQGMLEANNRCGTGTDQTVLVHQSLLGLVAGDTTESGPTSSLWHTKPNLPTPHHPLETNR